MRHNIKSFVRAVGKNSLFFTGKWRKPRAKGEPLHGKGQDHGSLRILSSQRKTELGEDDMA